MNRLRSALANLGLVVASVLVTVGVLELVLRALPVAWAPPVHVPTGADPILRYQASTPFTWSIGWDFDRVIHDRTNAEGFVADYDYDPAATTPLVAVVGDSFIEAMQVPFAASLTGRLQHDLGSVGRAYAFAIAGSPASQYIAFARHACEVYRPQRLVINVVGNDFDESVYEHRHRDGLFNLHRKADGSFDWTLTPVQPPGPFEAIARHSALALYLARNVGVPRLLDIFKVSRANAQGAGSVGIADSVGNTDLIGNTGFVGNTEAAAPPARVEEGYAVIDWFVDAMGRLCVKPADLVLAVDAPRPQIYDERALAEAQTSYFGLMRTRLIERARARGFTVVDLVPAFRADWLSNHRRFERPSDFHWNEAGHEVAERAVRDALAGWPPLAAARGQP